MKYAFGIDIGGTTVKIGLFDETGSLLEKWEIPTDRTADGVNILPDIAASVKGKMEAHGIGAADILGAGIDVPGAVADGKTVNRCVNLGWGVRNIAEEFEALLPVRTAVGNDANCAALGEMWKGGGEGFRNVVMLTLGTGIGGGVILNGEILPGAFGAGGEVGHMPVDPAEEEMCGCGGYGHLEQYASATGFTRLAKRYLAAHPDEETALRAFAKDGPAAKDIFDLAKAGDPAAMAVTEEAGEILGRAMASISCVVDPEVFVIGGGVSKAGEYLTDLVARYYRKYAFHASKETKITLARLGNDAGIYGAVKMVLLVRKYR